MSARFAVAALVATCASCSAPAPAPEEAPLPAPPAPAEGSAAAIAVVVAVPPPAPAPPPEPRRPYDPWANVRAPTDLVLAPVALIDAVAAGVARPGGARGTLVLTVDGCMIDEAEPFSAGGPADLASCRAQVRDNFDARGQRALVVPAGAWEIVVRNARTDRPAGFWLRASDSPAETLATAGGIAPGGEGHFDVELTTGTWLYSCPLTPTPDYLLVVP